jgi:hypothetical protein
MSCLPQWTDTTETVTQNKSLLPLSYLCQLLGHSDTTVASTEWYYFQKDFESTVAFSLSQKYILSFILPLN